MWEFLYLIFREVPIFMRISIYESHEIYTHDLQTNFTSIAILYLGKSADVLATRVLDSLATRSFAKSTNFYIVACRYVSIFFVYKYHFNPLRVCGAFAIFIYIWHFSEHIITWNS